MLNIKYFYTGLELWGCLFTIMAGIYLIIGKTAIKEQFKALAKLECVVGVMLFFDAMAWLFRGVPGNYITGLLYVVNYVSIVCNAIIPILISDYVFLSLNKNTRDSKPVLLNCAIGLCAVIFMALSQIRGYVFTIDSDTNLYRRGDGFIIWTVLVLIEALIALLYTCSVKEQIPWNRFFSVINFIAVPVLASAVQLLIYGFSLSNIAITIIALIIFAQALEDNAKTLTQQRAHIEEQEKELQDMRTRIALSQIKPHFLYNALNSIYVLCEKDPSKAQELVNSLSDYLRANIASIDTEKPIPFEKELEHTRVYLNIERARFQNRFNIEYDIDVSDFFIPALTVQPLVENAVKHGVCKRPYGFPGVITISTRKENAYIKVSITDNGVGFDYDEYKKEANKEGKHIGIQNVRNRLKIMENAELHVESAVGKGTTVEIIVPYNSQMQKMQSF